MYSLNDFLAQARTRSIENSSSFDLLYQHKKYAVCIGLLRQELDTLIRVSYLWHDEVSTDKVKALLSLSSQGKEWGEINLKGKFVRITDREMVTLASHLGGWEQLIYNYGCKLIHLSNFHLHESKDPVASLEKSERDTIVEYLKFYHQYPKDDLTFSVIIDYLPKVMEKLLGNTEFFIKELEDRHVGP
jgi:hypothetical protein